MKITCEEASHICDKSQYKEASFWEILKLRLHNLYCKACARHTKRNQTLTSLCNRANLRVLSDSEKETMKQDLEEKL